MTLAAKDRPECACLSVMTISEDLIMKHLNWSLDMSDPGDMLHHLAVLRAPEDAVTAFGTVDEEKLHSTLYAIDPSGTPEEVKRLVAATFAGAHTEAATAKAKIVFVSMTQETWGLDRAEEDPEVRRVALQWQRQGKSLEDHPDVIEATLVYAACQDGRRWRGMKFLTGSRAGQKRNVDLLVGKPMPGESRGVLAEPLIRRLVGIRP